MSLTLAPSASSPTPSRWIPPSWLGRSRSHLELRSRAKEVLSKVTTPDLALLDSLVQDSTLAAAISSASPRASTRWQDGLDRVPLLEPGPGSENPLWLRLAAITGPPRQPCLRSHATCYTYHLRAVNSLASVSQVKGSGWGNRD